MLWLLGLTFVHVFGEGGLALYESLRTGSLALLAFGLESIIEGGAAFLAVRHLRHLADEEEDHARRDQMLAQWIGISFLLLAAYTLGRGALEIFGGTHVKPSKLGLFLTIFATFGMPVIGWFKWKTSQSIGSKGLAAEAKESIACSIDSGLTMLAMIAGLVGRPGLGGPGAVAADGALVPPGGARPRARPCPRARALGAVSQSVGPWSVWIGVNPLRCNIRRLPDLSRF